MNDEYDHLVWSNQHRAWWRANSRGYTKSVLSAGRYTRREAVEISGKGRDGWLDPSEIPDELAIPISSLPDNIRALYLTPTDAGRAAFPSAERS